MRRSLFTVFVGAVLSGFGIAQQPSAGLIEAVRAGKLADVSALLAKGADANIRGPQNITPLLVAASMGNVPIAKALLAKGAHVNVQDSSSWQVSPLMAAALAGRLDMMKLLLDNKADLELKNEQGSTALLFATQAADPKTGTDLLLERGAKRLPKKDALAAWIEVGVLPQNSKCFDHIEGPRCDNSKKSK